MTDDSDNRRRFRRVLFDHTAELACEAGHTRVRLVDLSLKGALVAASRSLVAIWIFNTFARAFT